MIRPTFQAFETAKRALNVAQLGLDTVGHNISNAQTLGYTRQRIDQVSLSLNGYASKFAVFGVNSIGQGATIKGISQIRDPYLDNRYRAEAATNGELGVKSDGLTDICNIFDEIMNDGLHAKMGELISALDKFSFSADSKELASVVRSMANQLVGMINKNADQLTTARTEQVEELKITVESDVNNILKQIASLNARIEEDNFYGNPSNELNDERNLLIDKLSEYMDIKVVKTPVKMSNGVTLEILSLELKDAKDEDGNPIKLVDSNLYSQLEVRENSSNGNVSIHVAEGIGGNTPEAALSLYKGALKGYVDIINGAGPNAETGVSTFKGIPYYQQSLDEFAQKLAEVFNRMNNVSALEAANSGSKNGTDPLLEDTYGYKNLFVPMMPSLRTKAPATDIPSWMDSITSGSLQFSGGDYPADFAYDSSATPPTITATIDGRTYTAEYEPNKKISFIDDVSGEVAFSVNTTGDAPAASSGVIIDAKITASNISISSSWFDNSLYLTATKFNPVTDAHSKLTLTGGANPAWLKSVEVGGEGVTIKDGNYVFTLNTSNTPNTVDVVIDGVTYSADYPLPPNSRVEFKSSTGKIGLIANTTEKNFGTKASENTATVRNESGVASDNILALKNAINASNGYFVSGFSGNFQEFLVSFYKDMSLDKELNDSLLDASLTVIGAYADRRDAISAVSIDEEGINMMTYQNYYNAAARYMTTLDEALDKIINGMGIVGR